MIDVPLSCLFNPRRLHDLNDRRCRIQHHSMIDLW